MATYKILKSVLGMHEGGTKFYELVVLENQEGARFTIRRYGKNAMIKSGGASMSEPHSTWEYDKLESLKAKGGYKFRAGGGLADTKNWTGTPIGLTFTDVEVASFYSNTSQYRDILINLGMADRVSPIEDASIPYKVKPAEVKKEAPKVEGWGAW